MTNNQDQIDLQLELLARLPILLNSTLDRHRVIEVALHHLQGHLAAEAATVFIQDPETSGLTFWALRGAGTDRLEGHSIPAGKGIVGWVIEHQQPVHVPDVQNDPRFFGAVDREGGFKTRDLLCVPLTVRGTNRIGALQVLNSQKGFDEAQLRFLEIVAPQIALAIDNSLLFERLVQATERLRLLDTRKGELIALLAHEFKTPLSIIQSAAELVTSGDIKNEKILKELGDMLRSGVERLGKVVSQIHTMSTLSSRATQLTTSSVPVAELLEQLIQSFQPIIQERQLALSIKVEPPLVRTEADERLLRLIISNLLSNAIRFTPNGGSISIVATYSTGLIHFSISDTGIGIAPEQQLAIFEKFYEVTDILKHSSGDYGFRSCGLGLGLAAVKAMLEAHRSKINVESTLGTGSTFSFTLPSSTS